MADIYTPPKDSAYLLSTGFQMPHKNGDKWAMAFDSYTGTILTAGLSVVITILFLCLWNLISFVGMFFDGKKTRRRYVALVTLWNSNDPWFACKELLHYAVQCLKDSKASGDFWYGFGFGITAFIVFAGGIVTSVMVPSALLIGNVAPVRPSSVFYPELPAGPVRSLQRFGLLAPAAMRSLGSVEAAEVTLRERVSVEEEPKYSDPRDPEPTKGVKYNYSLSGVDMGLRWGSKLSLEVTGACITEYGWVNKRANTSDSPGDMYQLWNMDSQTVLVPISEDIIRDAPSASFVSHPDGHAQLLKDSNVSYAVIIHSARRTSITKSNDPWYATENRDEPEGKDRYEADYWMKRYRPILSCWQKDQWSYGSESVKSVDGLKNVTGIKIKPVLLEVLEAAFGDSPMIVKLGSASGVSALRSQTTSPKGVIDAQQCTMVKDMERLILASFVASRSIFTDATMFGIGDDTYPSIIRDTNGNPKSGAGDFVVASPEIQTFSLNGITALLVLLGFLVFVNAVTSWLLRFFHRNQEDAVVDRGTGNNEVDVDRWTRFRVLGAVHLFRCLYEGDGDKVKPRGWSCEKTVPENTAEGDFKMHLLRGCKKDKCMGHLSKNLAEQSDGGKSDSNPKEKSLVTNTGVSDDEAAGEDQGMLSSSPKRVNL
ncbi:hypothetical protein LCI18_005082 [Fusarium solani-melongenae]|uniref:Uncharacterized protein n=1 Tax=Fusarium solani subsp. cucurbitae TaxID=2747967 RepID=A0ACD3YZ51_FUSSC|nr:hypothetical protein LCI18_005082 [Fusarium solani-melongenae]